MTTCLEQNCIMALPKDMLTDIVCRLPASTLYKNLKAPLSLYNKEFRDITSDPKFPRLFQTYDKFRPCSFLAYSSDEAKTFLIEYDPNRKDFIYTQLNMDFVQKIGENFESPSLFYLVLGSCNGWLLVSLTHENNHDRRDHSLTSVSMYLVNPITRRYVTILPVGSPPCQAPHSYAFGYIPKTGKYKVVRFFAHSYEIITINDDKFCRSGSYDARYQEYAKEIPSIKKPVVCEGSMYWLVDNGSEILKLDLEKEEFELVPTPGSVHDSGYCKGILGLLGETLYMAILTFSDGVEFWLMNGERIGVEKPWTKLIVIPHFVNLNKPFEVIQVLDNTKILVLLPEDRKFYVYDLKQNTREEKVVDMQGLGIMDVLKVVPSFLSLKQHM